MDSFVTDTDWRAALKRKVLEFMSDDNSRMLYMGGQTGSGKTHLCTAVCADYMRRGYNCYYMRWADESKRIKASITDPEAYSALVGKLKSVDVLYIDDFLKTAGDAPTKGDINLAFEIVNYRNAAENKVTIISSELTLIDIKNNVDEAIAGRIFELCGEKYGIGIKRDTSKNWRFRNMKNEF